MQTESWRRLWYWIGFTVLLCMLSVPFFWRSAGTLNGIILGLFSLLAFPSTLLLGGILCFGFRKLRLADFATVSLALVFAFGLTDWLDGLPVRKILFSARYSRHRTMVEETLKEFPSQRPANFNIKGRQAIPKDRTADGAAYSAFAEYDGDNLRMTLETPSGPTLETTLFSPSPVNAPQLVFVKQDELGYWYLVLR